MQYIHLAIEGWGCGSWCYPMQRGRLIKKVGGRKDENPTLLSLYPYSHLKLWGYLTLSGTSLMT
jgi:hypothetical protein